MDVWEKCCEEDAVPEANRAPLIIEQPSLRLERRRCWSQRRYLSLGRVETELCSKSHGAFPSEDSCHWLVHSLTLPHSPTHLLFISSKHSFSVCFPGVKLAGLQDARGNWAWLYSLQSYSPLRMYLDLEKLGSEIGSL